MFIFWNIWCALFSCVNCFEIRLFALLPTIINLSTLHLLSGLQFVDARFVRVLVGHDGSLLEHAAHCRQSG